MPPVYSRLIARGELVEGNLLRLLADVPNIGGGQILRSDLTSLTWSVSDVSDDLDAPTETGSGELVINDVWLDANVTGDTATANGWPAADTAGYNMEIVIPPDPFLMTRNRIGQFRLEVLATTTEGDEFWASQALIDVVPSPTKSPP